MGSNSTLKEIYYEARLRHLRSRQVLIIPAVGKLDTQQSSCCGSSPNARRLETPEEPMRQGESKGRTHECASSGWPGGSPLFLSLCVLVRPSTDWTTTTQPETVICFIQSPEPSVTPSETPFQTSVRGVSSDQMSGHAVAQTS